MRFAQLALEDLARLLARQLGVEDDGLRNLVVRKPFAQPGSDPSGAVDASATDLSALVAAFRQAGTGWACLCASDAVYGREAKRTAQALVAAGATRIYFAGRAGQAEATLREAGVSTFIYADCDALAILQAAYRDLQG